MKFYVILLYVLQLALKSSCFVQLFPRRAFSWSPHTDITLSAKKIPSSAGDGTDSNINNSKLESLNAVIKQIERAHGKGTLTRLGDSTALDIQRSLTGSYTLDAAVGGGYPKGRVVEIYGPESSGKTTLALHAIAEVQKTGGHAAFIDVEHALDPIYAANLGVNVNELLVCQPDCGEIALDIVEQLIQSSAVDIIVVDSVAALVPRVELEGEMTDMQVGLQARLMSKALRKIIPSLSKSQTTVLFLNQLRSKVGVMYGNPEVTSGGNALKFYSSIRLDIRKKEVLANNEGILVKVKVVKNKVFPPFRVVEFEILFGSGINKMGTLMDAGEAVGVLVRKGPWYSYGALSLGQGKKAATEYILKNPKLFEEIEGKIIKALGNKTELNSDLVKIEVDEGASGEEDLSEFENDTNQ